MTTTKECTHREQIQAVTPSGEGCKECLETRGEWRSLRLCRTCGHIGCCDSSPNTHATKHFQQTGHPIIQAYKGNRGDWSWCYVDETYVDGQPTPAP